MNKIYDPIRKKFVEKTAEEIIRQNLLFKMVNHLNYPKSLISVEKDIFLLAHLRDQNINSIKRRADILVFYNDKNFASFLYPLLMIECKAGKLTKSAVDQIVGYNFYVRAYFIAIANGGEIMTFYKKEDEYKQIDFLPTYNDLIKSLI